MHSTRAHHHHLFRRPWIMSDVAITLLIVLLFLVLLLLLVGTAQHAYAQSSVPPTARQAANVPQFAARLRTGATQNASRASQPYHLQSSYRNPLRSRERGWLPTDNIVYDNGPINGTTDAWTINFGFIVSNTLTIPSGGASVSSLSFGAWLFPGDVLQTVEVLITDSEFGGNTYFDGVVNFLGSNCIGNQYGFNVCTEATSSDFGPVALGPGTYWVNLQNAQVNTGDPVYWDENSGPSLASENSVGTIPSEAFTLLGSATTSTQGECVHDKGPLKVIHSFTDGLPTPGLAMDPAGNFYGTVSPGGAHGFGSAYQLALRAGNWIFTNLYSFVGGAGGQYPSSDIIGPQGALYGSADGGIQACGSRGDQYCGVVYRLRPSPIPCLTALCSWNEDAIYEFTGDLSGWRPRGNVVSDAAGNLYGITGLGGIYGNGTAYELSHIAGGWTEKVIHGFESGIYVNSPLFLGHDGNLYGSAYTGNQGGGVIFQLAPSGDGWTENIIASFPGCTETGGSCGARLVGVSENGVVGVHAYVSESGCGIYARFGRIFDVSYYGGGWHVGIIDDTFGNLGECATGGDGFDNYAGGYATEEHVNSSNTWSRVIRVPHQVRSQFCNVDPQTLVCFYGDRDYNDTPFSGRDLEIDASGKIYGTTEAYRACNGTVWQVTPP